MQEIQALIGRMRELTVQALNGTYTNEDRSAMNDEFQQLMDEIDKISHTTDY
jgi:flagellin